jgi:putative CocE/NonD family hydrolase
MTWYDVSTGPNLAAYNFVRDHAKGEAANQQYAIIAPTLHCQYKRASEHTVVGERDMGDARLDYDAITYAWFDHFLKGEDNQVLEKTPKVQYYTMGMNKWQHSNTWPPEGAKPVTLTLTSQGHANTLHGDGVLTAAAAKGEPALLPVASPAAPQSKALKLDQADTFTYDPMHPTPSYGGNVCCAANTIPGNGGALDQRKMEERQDILVYTSEPLTKDVEVSGPITVTLYKGKVYKVTLTPMNTSNLFAAGHRIRLEVAGANFPRFDRNLNTGGNNYDETTAVVAHTSIHHNTQYPSTMTLTVVPAK